MSKSCTLIEPGIGQWRSARIGEDEFPETLNFHEDIGLGAVDAVFDARVSKVEHALDMAFLDLGDGRTGMLSQRRAKLLAKGGRTDDIGALVQEGQMLRVQVLAEPSAYDDKALPVTPRPRLTGRYVVVEAGGARLNFSKDIGPKAVKDLTALLSSFAEKAAIIVRSRAGEVSPEAVAREAERLTGILSGAMADKPGLVHAFSPMEQALLAVGGATDILVEGGDALAQCKAAAQKYWPDLASGLKLYKKTTPLFESYGVEEAIEEALGDRIELPSGGWISISETNALTVVDVNMGGALKGRGANEAKLTVNLEAAMALAYHLRFQDIGGLIVVDFIDMSQKGAPKDLMDVLDAALKDDDVPVQHTGVSTFGLVEFSRKRRGLSLRQRLMRPRAMSERPQAAALRLIRSAERLGKTAAPGVLTLNAPADVINWLERETGIVAALGAATGRTVSLATGSSGVHLG